jgi:hypothetical protein
MNATLHQIRACWDGVLAARDDVRDQPRVDTADDEWIAAERAFIAFWRHAAAEDFEEKLHGTEGRSVGPLSNTPF